MSRLAVITPIGPGHMDYVASCVEHVTVAIQHSVYSNVKHVLVDDTDGKLGRSQARNRGMDEAADSDWYFFLDADDTMLPWTLSIVPRTRALFGSVMTLRRGVMPNDRPISSWDDLFSGGIVGSLSMGAFFSAKEARELMFHGLLDAGEDFEFYLSFCSRHSFEKVKKPFVVIRDDRESAVGPRGYASLDWCAACRPFWDFWEGRGRRPLDAKTRSAVCCALRELSYNRGA